MRSLLTTLAAALGLAALPPAPALAAERAPEAPEGPLVKPRLIAEHAQLTPGRVNWIALHFDITPKWHIYWNGVNDTGFPPKAAWTLPPGYAVGDLLWPAPMRHVAEGDILDHIYEGRVTLLAPLTVPASAAPGDRAQLRVALEWLVCQEACIPEETTLTFTIPIGPPDATPTPSPEAPLFKAARDRLPQPWSAADARLKVEFASGRATLTAPGAERLAFYPLPAGSKLTNPIPDAAKDGEQLVIRLDAGAAQPHLVGVVEITPKAAGAAPILLSVDARR